jgi:mycothiol system anti-sigma-R factor
MVEQGDVEQGDLEELNCTETVHRLYHFLDGELTPDRRATIARHLDDCSPCLDAYDFEADVRRLIADKCRDHVPDHLREKIAAAIEHEHKATIAAAAVDGDHNGHGHPSA